MNGWDFLIVAESLQNSSLERDLRTAVGRAYYAVYNGIAEPLRERGIPIPEDTTGHADLWKWLDRCGDPLLGVLEI